MQILAAPRIGDRLSALAIDPSNPDHIYVGTEEGTVVRSTDGGITWQESQLSPFNVLARSVGGPVRIPTLPSLDYPREADIGFPPVLDRRTRSRIDPDVDHIPLSLPVPPTSSVLKAMCRAIGSICR